MFSISVGNFLASISLDITSLTFSSISSLEAPLVCVCVCVCVCARAFAHMSFNLSHIYLIF